ncbi:hypothetical protein SODALDRAFT_361734 [Sodiomyces alkalinus F11]|uniref:Uncharacterized protein n=1 Tax=Sodiomyces alkalinus (strain CBS 110278 / VKM F-3762 / F11) TaxID=1314773 RepID=A0A3N2PRD3_SODAK|nr:hypothetical protein SODALDRAFT_361734 [Sodiomyces alkalinus F11]ROT36906.1 hypothetical protein SODALDRAFT_361734 [Sodiomyces alkalinus F11]
MPNHSGDLSQFVDSHVVRDIVVWTPATYPSRKDTSFYHPSHSLLSRMDLRWTPIVDALLNHVRCPGGYMIYNSTWFSPSRRKGSGADQFTILPARGQTILYRIEGGRNSLGLVSPPHLALEVALDKTTGEPPNTYICAYVLARLFNGQHSFPTTTNIEWGITCARFPTWSTPDPPSTSILWEIVVTLELCRA